QARGGENSSLPFCLHSQDGVVHCRVASAGQARCGKLQELRCEARLAGGARSCPAERSSASKDSLTCHAERSETIRSRTVSRSRSIPTSPRFSIHGYRSFAREPSVAVGM